VSFAHEGATPVKGINQPFYRKASRCWYVKHNGKQVRLDESRAQSYALWHKMVSQESESKTCGFTFSEMVYKFLDDLQHNRSSRTLEWYQERLSLFLAEVGKTVACHIKPFEVLAIVNKHKNWSANTKRNSLRAIKRVYKWAHINGLLETNLMVNLELPPQESRELVVTPEQMAVLEDCLSEGPFKDLLRIAWDTGMRPEELFRIEADWIKGEQITIPPKSAKGKQLRIVYLGTQRSQEILAKYATAHPLGPLLRNTLGKKWTRNSIKCQFQRLRKRNSISLHLGAFRKGFCTEALKAGLDTVTVAHLMGHKDAVMVSRVYGKVAQDKSWMIEAAKRAKRSKRG
jgi:integrase/recombinase XerC